MISALHAIYVIFFSLLSLRIKGALSQKPAGYYTDDEISLQPKVPAALVVAVSNRDLE